MRIDADYRRFYYSLALDKSRHNLCLGNKKCKYPSGS